MPWSKLALRLSILTIALVVILVGTAGLFGETSRYDPWLHLRSATLLFVMVPALILLLLHWDRLRLRDIGQHALGANLRAFALGAGLWLLPALLGMAVCVMLGWSSITLHSSAATLLAAVPILALAVFLGEAFPEELALRGYVQSLVGRKSAQWVALLVQAAIFVAVFVIASWAFDTLHPPGHWVFIAGFGLILGYTRALSGNVWTGMGVHTAWQTTAQLMLGHGHVSMEGVETLLFFAFSLLPSATLATVFSLRRPDFRWTAREAPDAR